MVLSPGRTTLCTAIVPTLIYGLATTHTVGEEIYPMLPRELPKSLWEPATYGRISATLIIPEMQVLLTLDVKDLITFNERHPYATMHLVLPSPRSEVFSKYPLKVSEISLITRT